MAHTRVQMFQFDSRTTAKYVQTLRK